MCSRKGVLLCMCVHVCVLCLEGTGSGDPWGPSWFYRACSPRDVRFGVLGGLCGQKNVYMPSKGEPLCALWVSSSTRQFLRTWGLRRVGEPAQRIGQMLWRPLCPPTWQRAGSALGTAPPCGAARWALRHPREADDLPGEDGMWQGNMVWGIWQVKPPRSRPEPLHPGCANFPVEKRL